MGTFAPLEALYTAAPQSDADDDLDGRPDEGEMLGATGQGTLGPELQPEMFDAAILAGLVQP